MSWLRLVGGSSTVRPAGAAVSARSGSMVVMGVAAALVCTSCGGGTTRSAATTLNNAASNMDAVGAVIGRGSGGVDEAVDAAGALKRQIDELEALSPDEFGGDDLARREEILTEGQDLVRRFDNAVARQADDAADRFAAEQVFGATDDLAWELVLATKYPHTTNEEFIAKLQQRTAEAVREAVCEQVLDTLAPEEAPESTVGQIRQNWVDPALEVGDRLARLDGFPIARLGDWVDKGKYASQVFEAAERGAANYEKYDLQDPRLVQLASRPPVRRAVVLYLRTCFTPPKSVAR